MLAVIAPNSTQSRFVEHYRAALAAWAQELESRPGVIVAIARKAPRLIELLVAEGMLSPTILRRVISERALPFLDQPPDAITVVDDAIRWGSTFQKVITLSRDVITSGKSGADVIGLPLAVSSEADERFLACVPKYFLKLREADVAPFAQEQVSAYRLGGKPLDIDHPTVDFRGDFADIAKLESLLSAFAAHLTAQLIPLTSMVPTVDGPMQVHAWTLLLPPFADDGLAADLCKLRLYLNASHNRLTVAAMHPIAVPQSALDRAPEYLPPFAEPVWKTIARTVRWDVSDRLSLAAERSLATMFNWLHSMPLLLRAAAELDLAFTQWDWTTTSNGPAIDDLRFLLGSSLARRVEPILAETSEATAQASPPADIRPELVLPKASIPPAYWDEYSSQLATLRQNALVPEDLLQAIFLAQHFGVELASRRAHESVDDRLEFGVTFRYLLSETKASLPDSTAADIHAAFDRLIDEGCIVPRYIRMEVDDEWFWVRAYRVGEGPLERLLHTVRLLAETLSKELGTETIPPLLLEKYAVLVLSDDLRQRRLESMASLPTHKDFYLYGARQSVVAGREKRFLLEWAMERKVLEDTGKDEDDVRRAYRVRDGLEAFLPASDIPWDKDARRAIRDLAKFVVRVQGTRGLGTDALVMITSVATDEEHLKAAEAELDLWLHDRRASVCCAVAELALLADDLKRGASRAPQLRARLGGVAELLARTANFTAQEAIKTNLADRRAAVLKGIDKAVAGDQVLEDVWEDISDILGSREVRERRASGLPTILSALRIAYATNRVLRDLLAHAGWNDAEGRSLPLPKSLDLFEERLWGTAREAKGRVDDYAQRFLASWNGRPHIRDLIAQARDMSDRPFAEAFDAFRCLILEVADRCSAILHSFGSAQYRERPLVLEPPLYIVMWDIEGSTEREQRQPMEDLIAKAHERIANTLGDDLLDFRPQSRDDGNGLICHSLSDALLVFGILLAVYSEAESAGEIAIRFRCGVEANLQGRLHYYPKTKLIDEGYGGRAYEHAARVATFFKEIDADNTRWSGEGHPEKPPSSYLVVGEFARRFAEQEGSWPAHNWDCVELAGQYLPRVHGSLPIQVSVLTANKSRKG